MENGKLIMKHLIGWVLISGFSLFMVSTEAASQREGKAIFNTTCFKCHLTGETGAPKVGNKEDWQKRASKGLTSLTQNAIQGIRLMPAHGGNDSLSDFEISRAITFMVNQSGGHWIEPLNLQTLAAPLRTGKQVVQEQCYKCHQTGKNGAPRIGDNLAWIPRLKNGIDLTVNSAIHGHGGMPPRGERADLTDVEIRAAIIYMYHPVDN